MAQFEECLVDRLSDIQPSDNGPDSRHSADAADLCLAPEPLRLGRKPVRYGRRIVGWTIGVLATLVVMAGLALGAFYILLSMGPIALDSLGQRVAKVLDDRLGDDYAVSVGHAVIERGADGPQLAIGDFQITGRNGQPVFDAPRVTVSVDPLPLLVGRVSPRRLDVFGLDLRLVVRSDGSVALSAAKEPAVRDAPAGASLAPAPPDDTVIANVTDGSAEHDAVAPLAASLRRLLAMAVGSGSPLSALERVGIAGGRLVFDDRPGGRSYPYSNLEVGFEKVAETARLTVSAEGPNGRWRVSAQARGDAGQGVSAEANAADGLARSLEVDVNNLSVDEITLIAGLRDPMFDFDMPVSGRLNMALAPDGKLEMASGRFRVGTGFFYIKDPDHEPLPVDEVTGGFRWDVAARRFEIQPVLFSSNRTQLSVAGMLTPPESKDDEWRLALSGDAGVFGAERPGEADIVVDRSEFVVRFNPNARTFALENFALKGPNLAYSMAGSGQWTGGARRLTLRAEAGRTLAKTIVRLWPTPVAAHTRAWLLLNQSEGFLDTGSMNLDLDEAAFVAIHDHRPIADNSLAIDFAISEAQLDYLPGAPPLSGLSGKGRVTGRAATFVVAGGYVDLGAKGRLSLMEGRFDAPDFAAKPAPANVTARAGGTLDAVTDLMAREALKSYGGFAAEPGTMKGQVDARVSVDLRLGVEAVDDVASVRVAAQITNLSIEKLVGKERLEQATLSVNADSAGMKAWGQGKLFGQPARIELKKPAQGVAEAVLTMTLDEAARAKQGWGIGALSGPVGARVSSVIGGGDKIRPQVELDLTKAAIGPIVPGFSKLAGRAAKASFQLVSEGDKSSLQSFSFESGAALAQGVIEFDAAGFNNAKLSHLRLSPGDDMRVEAQQSRDSLRLVVRGGTIDARPFIQDMLANSAPPGGRDNDGPPRELDLDLKANLLTGNNGQSMSNMELRLVKRASAVREFHLSGRTGRAALTGGMLATGPGAAPQFFVRSSDGGALMSFLDLYRRMDGGQLQLVALGSGNQMSGVLTVREFMLRNEPALRRLVAEGGGNRDERTPPPIDPNAVSFDRLQVSFQRTGARLDMRDGAINGPTVGATIEGMLDFGRDQVALNGTFVPAYGVNNLFAKIPLFGPILGGGANEGLIGVNFRITGAASAPLLSINPLSAIAPGFLRKIFGAADAMQTPRPPDPEPELRPRMPMSVSPSR